MGIFSSKINAERDLENLKGKVVIVTGGSGGIGLYTIQFLVRQGAKVYMGARNETKARDAIKKLEADGLGSLGGSVEWLDLDISHPNLAKAAAERFLQKEKRLDVLVNNAAMFAVPYEVGPEGVQKVVMTNHIGTYALTEALLPILKETAKEPDSDVRIVGISSLGHSLVSADSMKGKEALNRKFGTGMKAELDRYNWSKLLNLLHTKELQRRLSAENANITCIAVHPGAVATPGFLNYGSSFRVIGPIMPTLIKFLVTNETDGAMTSAFAASAKAIRADKNKYKGVYLVPYGKIEKASKSAEDPRLATELWETTEAVVKEM